MTINGPDDRLPASLQDYQQRFLSTAEPGWSSYLQAKLREQHGDIPVVEFSSYLYVGGAHGMPGRGFINYDRELNRELRPEDLLIPGQEGNFWRVARQAHQRWLVENEHDQDAEFVEFLALPADPAYRATERSGAACTTSTASHRTPAVTRSCSFPRTAQGHSESRISLRIRSGPAFAGPL